MLLIGGTICAVVILVGGGIVLLALLQPTRDTSNAGRALGDLVNTMVGLLAGFLAGRTDVLRALDEARYAKKNASDSEDHDDTQSGL
jgi:hypothetical protein